MLKFCSKNRRGNDLIKYINHILSKMDLQSYQEKTSELTVKLLGSITHMEMMT